MNMKWMVALLIVVLGVALCLGQRGSKASAPEKSPVRKDKVVLSESEWQKRLSPAAFDVLRKEGTERPGTGEYVDKKENGVYLCAGCGLPLFDTDAQFHSGTGWPSYFRPHGKDSIWTKTDRTFGFARTEVRCARCDGHLGHVFDDAPQTPTGLRYCINSVALKFKKS